MTAMYNANYRVIDVMDEWRRNFRAYWDYLTDRDTTGAAWFRERREELTAAINAVSNREPINTDSLGVRTMLDFLSAYNADSNYWVIDIVTNDAIESARERQREFGMPDPFAVVLPITAVHSMVLWRNGNDNQWGRQARAIRVQVSNARHLVPIPEGTSLPDGVVLSRGLGIPTGYQRVTLDAEGIERVPVAARPYAVRLVRSLNHGETGPRLTWDAETNRVGIVDISAGDSLVDVPTADELRRTALESYRAILRSRFFGSSTPNTFEAERQKHRAESAKRYEAFTRRKPDEVKHIPTLPFVPHGLSSSRKWGIEVESGGARGVTAPESWRRIRDGSLRSAWEGHVEVQDFEPFDEEVTARVSWYNCENNARHEAVASEYYEETGEYIQVLNPNYLDPRECELCGNVTRIVHRTPQTITHRRQDDDCAEFVSPILVSMHSKGLEYLCTELSKQPQNSTAGVHVHVEANDLTPMQLSTLVAAYDILEPFLEASYQRESREYCRRRTHDLTLEAARSAKSRKDARAGQGNTRYVTLNLESLNKHGTVEFRAMGAVYDYEYLARWAMFCREMVNVVAAGATVAEFSRARKWGDVLAILAKYGKEYVRAQVFEMTGEVGEAAKLVKEEQPVTTEALDADLERVLSSRDAWTSLSRWVVSSTREFADQMSILQSRLVTASATVET